MQLHIRHETRYRYDRPVKYSVQSLHLTPRRDPSQRALTWSITAPGRRLEQIDAHGNIQHVLTIEQPHREIQIVVRGVVETADTEGRQDDGPLSHLAYLASTTLTAPNDELKAFARKAVERAKDPRARAEALAEAVFGAVKYKTGASDVQDSAATAFKSGEGVCQDHAHVYIASARTLGMPARYVSGYVYTGDTRHPQLLPSRRGARLSGCGPGARRAPRRRRRAHGSKSARGRVGARAAIVMREVAP
jgi:transglutaminase-like putative cysteine protease